MKYQERLLEAERLARKEKAGLWGEEPSEEDVKTDADGGPYVASKKSHVYHIMPACGEDSAGKFHTVQGSRGGEGIGKERMQKVY